MAFRSLPPTSPQRRCQASEPPNVSAGEVDRNRANHLSLGLTLPADISNRIFLFARRALVLANRNPFVARAGIGHCLHHAHVAYPIFKGRVRSRAVACFDGIEEVIFYCPFAREFPGNSYFG